MHLNCFILIEDYRRFTSQYNEIIVCCYCQAQYLHHFCIFDAKAIVNVKILDKVKEVELNYETLSQPSKALPTSTI